LNFKFALTSGNYIHGNEPSHHIPYLYCYAGEPWKTQECIHDIMNKMYKNAADGLCGNYDCGQMSAWYIFSALGFYPVTPENNEYEMGSPFIKEATINLENGNKFKVIAENYSEKNIYIEEIQLNNEKIPVFEVTGLYNINICRVPVSEV